MKLAGAETTRACKKCNKTDNTADNALFDCWSNKCSNVAHLVCSNELKADFVLLSKKDHVKLMKLNEDEVICGKRCFNHLCNSRKETARRVENSRFWHMDGPDEYHNSMSILMDWMTTHGNYRKWRGGNKHSGVTKRRIAGEIATLIKQKINVNRDAKNIQNKIELLESQFKKATDWLNQTGAGCTEGEISDYIIKLCPYYNELKDVMMERHTTTPLDVIGASFGKDDSDTSVAEIAIESLSDSDNETSTQQTRGSKKRIAHLYSSSTSKKSKVKGATADYGYELVELKRQQLHDDSKARDKEYVLKEATALSNSKLVDAQVEKLKEETGMVKEERERIQIMTKATLLRERKQLLIEGINEDEINAVLPLTK
jgi:hypothetical protein